MDDDNDPDFDRTRHIGHIRLEESNYLKACGWQSRLYRKENRVVWFPPEVDDPKSADRVYSQDGAIAEQRYRDAKYWKLYSNIAAELHPSGDRELTGDLPPTIDRL